MDGAASGCRESLPREGMEATLVVSTVGVLADSVVAEGKLWVTSREKAHSLQNVSEEQWTSHHAGPRGRKVTCHQCLEGIEESDVFCMHSYSMKLTHPVAFCSHN